MAIKKETITRLQRLLKHAEITPKIEKGNVRIIEILVPAENAGLLCNTLWEIKWGERDATWKGKHDDGFTA